MLHNWGKIEPKHDWLSFYSERKFTWNNIDRTSIQNEMKFETSTTPGVSGFPELLTKKKFLVTIDN